MPVTLRFPIDGDLVRFLSGSTGTIAGVECVEDRRLVRADVIIGDGEPLLAVPVVWDPSASEWAEVMEPETSASDDD